MNYLPGTTVEFGQHMNAVSFLESAFALQGLVLSQIVQLTGLEAHTIQNWVKRKFVSPPQNKKYDIDQFCRIAIINMLKDIFQNDRIVHMLQYAEGNSEISDVMIYTTFVETMEVMPSDAVAAQTDLDKIIGDVVKETMISFAAQKRLEAVIKVMVQSYLSASIRDRADILLRCIEENDI